MCILWLVYIDRITNGFHKQVLIDKNWSVYFIVHFIMFCIALDDRHFTVFIFTLILSFKVRLNRVFVYCLAFLFCLQLWCIHYSHVQFENVSKCLHKYITPVSHHHLHNILFPLWLQWLLRNLFNWLFLPLNCFTQGIALICVSWIYLLPVSNFWLAL